MTSLRPRSIILLALLLAAGLWLASLSCFVDSLVAAPPKDVSPHDAIVVLTGGSNRLQTGFDLLDRKAGKKMFISGVYRGVDVKELIEQQKKSHNDGINCCVAVGFDADNTVGNAQESAQWMQKEGFASLYLVTSNYHMRRALLEFRRFAPELKITPWPVAPEKFAADNWWQDARAFSLVVREHAKYAVAWLRYHVIRVFA